MRQLLFFFIFLSSFALSFAQEFIGGVQLKPGIPIGDFETRSPEIWVPEMAAFANYQVPNLPIEIGLSLGYGLYGTKLEKRNDLYVGFSDELRLRRNNNLFAIMGVFRFFPQVYGRVFPFIEAQAGALYSFTRYSIRTNPFEEPIETGRDISDWARASQLGAGLMIPFKKPQTGQLEIRLMYQNTSRSDYLTREDTRFQPDPDGESDGQFIYSTRRSTFNMIQPSIGLSFFIPHLGRTTWHEN